MSTTLTPVEAPMLDYIKVDGEVHLYELTTADRGDCCGTQAYYKVWLKDATAAPLLFCGHHYQTHKSALRPHVRKVRDEYSRLNENRLTGTEN